MAREKSYGEERCEEATRPAARDDGHHPEHEEEFERWYTEEHLPDRASGLSFRTTLSGDRRRTQIHGFYDLAGPEVMETGAYRKIRTTPWTRAMEPRFKNFRRNIYVEITADLPKRRLARKHGSKAHKNKRGRN